MKKRVFFLFAAILMATTNLNAQTDCTNKHCQMCNCQFVTLTDVVPDAILEIRYYGTYNFVGTRIDGYEAPTALLTRVAADIPDTLMKRYFYPDLDKSVLFEPNRSTSTRRADIRTAPPSI